MRVRGENRWHINEDRNRWTAEPPVKSLRHGALAFLPATAPYWLRPGRAFFSRPGLWGYGYELSKPWAPSPTTEH